MKNIEQKTLTEVMENYSFWNKLAKLSSYLPFVLPILAFAAAMFFY